jgi:hypothetical protein
MTLQARHDQAGHGEQDTAMTGLTAPLLFVSASAAAFLLTAVVLLSTALPGPVGLVLAAFVSSLTAALFAVRDPARGWRWGLWASSVFLAYFAVVTLAYLSAGRPDWHPVFAGVLVLGASCVTAGGIATFRTRRSNGARST